MKEVNLSPSDKNTCPVCMTEGGIEPVDSVVDTAIYIEYYECSTCGSSWKEIHGYDDYEITKNTKEDI